MVTARPATVTATYVIPLCRNILYKSTVSVSFYSFHFDFDSNALSFYSSPSAAPQTNEKEIEMLWFELDRNSSSQFKSHHGINPDPHNNGLNCRPDKKRLLDGWRELLGGGETGKDILSTCYDAATADGAGRNVCLRKGICVVL